MGRIRDALDVLTGRAVKARPTPASWATWISGTGTRYVPPGSQFDYQREAGDLRRNSVVSICVQWLARQFLQSEWAIGYKNDEGEWEEIEDGPLVTIRDLLQTCNPFWPGRQTWQGVLSDYIVYGNAYLMKNRQANGGGKPMELYWLPAHQIEIRANPDPNAPHVVSKYIWDNGTGRQDFDPVDIIHFRDCPDPDNPIVGIGKIQYQIRNASAMNAGERYQASVLREPSVGKVISPKVSVENIMRGEVVDATTMQGVVDGIKKRLRGEGVGGLHASTIPIEAVEMNPSPEDMLLDRILDRPEAMIVSALGLNSMVLGLPSSRDTRTYANLAEARRDAWQHGVVPIQDDIADTLTRQLLAEYDPLLECWLDNDDVEALKEDANERATRSQTLFAATIVNRNEAREIAGFEPLEGADGELYYGEQTETQMAQAEASMQMQADMMGDVPATGGSGEEAQA